VTSVLNPTPRSFFAAAAAFRNGADSPLAFLERCIGTIDQHEPQIGAFVATNFEAARAAAAASSERWRAGTTLSLIDGMPVGIKDIMETADMVTEQGSPLFLGWRGGRDAAAVAALREAGAVIIGKTVTTEFASTEPRGTRNPWDLERTPGGSSSGSAAAVAAGMVPAALGTQVVGSILRPASFCGCFGFKPSAGGINRGGSFDEYSQSCTGVLAASLAEAWCVARAISARAGGDPGHPGITGPLDLPEAARPRRVAKLETAGWERATDDARDALEGVVKSLTSAGIEVGDKMSDEDIAASESAIKEATSTTRTINAWEGRWPLNTYARDMDRSRLSQAAQDRLSHGENMTQADYAAAVQERDQVREVYSGLRNYDLCISLSAPGPAPLGLGSTGDPVFAAASSILGVPSLSLPVLQAEGLPLGLQLLGFANADAELFASAAGMLPLLKS
jgi:Asp-tRNA(Asn)/Glu-tRNA(Gln) amidotransferase A subunit family amidase